MSNDAPEEFDATFDDLEEISDEEVEDLFTEMEIESVDDDAIWEELTAEDGEDPFDVADAEEDLGIEEVDPEADETIVEKSRYCQGCEHFSEPPEVSCSHDGTEIVEMTDMEHFRVRNCPIVERRRSVDSSQLTDDE